MGVELVEMRPLAVLARMLIAHPHRPVGRIGDEIVQVTVSLVRPAPSKTLRTSSAELHEAGDERIVPGDLAVAAGRAGLRPGRPADLFDAAQLGAEEKEIDAAGDHAQIGVVQDHAPIGVIGR